MKPFSQSWFTLSSLQLSGALSLPVIMVGYYLGQHYSFSHCLAQILIGNLLLFLVAIFYIGVIHQKKIVTIEFAQCLLGARGSLICAASMAFSLIGWSAIQIHLISGALGSPIALNLSVALLVYLLTHKGLGHLARVNQYILPCTLICLALLLIAAPKTTHPVVMSSIEPFTLGLMLIVTAGSGLVFDLPTFFRHAATPRDATVSLALIFLVLLPAIQGLGLYLGMHYAPVSNNGNWIENFIHSFNLSSMMFLMLSGVLGACLNLYSSSIIVNRSIGIPYRPVLLISCFLAALLAKINLEKHFSLFLEIINLNAEVLAALTLMYVGFKGARLPQPNAQQRFIHLLIFALVLLYAILTTLCHVSLSQDLFLDTALLSCFLMFIYYLPSLRRKSP